MALKGVIKNDTSQYMIYDVADSKKKKKKMDSSVASGRFNLSFFKKKDEKNSYCNGNSRTFHPCLAAVSAPLEVHKQKNFFLLLFLNLFFIYLFIFNTEIYVNFYSLFMSVLTSI